MRLKTFITITLALIVASCVIENPLFKWDSGPDGDGDTDSDIDGDGDGDGDGDTDSDIDGDGDGDADSDIDGDGDADADADGDSDVDTDADSDADVDGDVESETFECRKETCSWRTADGCSTSGYCQCGDSGEECDGATRCTGGECFCDPEYCLGCCELHRCRDGDENDACGADGGLCQNCEASGLTCQPDRTCG